MACYVSERESIHRVTLYVTNVKPSIKFKEWLFKHAKEAAGQLPVDWRWLPTADPAVEFSGRHMDKDFIELAADRLAREIALYQP